MKSQELFPLNKRLNATQLNELEGFKSNKTPSLIQEKYSDLILKYAKALTIAEQDLKDIFAGKSVKR